MLIEQTYDKLSQMKLFGMLNGSKERLSSPIHQDLSFTELFGLIVDDEWLCRENRKLALRLKGAKFKERDACLEGIDYRASRGIKKNQVLELAQNRWIGAHQNILITGPAGAGKSYLAQAFGNHACRQGQSTHYVRVPKLTYAFIQARADGSYGLFLKKMAKYKVLILDDFGLSPLSETEKQDLVELAEDRYGTGSTLVTSQLPINAWHEYMGGGRIADAFLERIVHNAHRITLNAQESMRKENVRLRTEDLSDA